MISFIGALLRQEVGIIANLGSCGSRAELMVNLYDANGT